ncbi:hypothetical protein AK830_g6737 [Neonectria ditissima]|uniref:Major facilitator superfamily (MFS) profile domain-containing protein n=1 Tax=Neonectria ditissima TaxID=78410 RepID=A0A0P7B188_9HYPO|nr:hypothetical protein AK830_g6737 [Neonectria ditissima]
MAFGVLEPSASNEYVPGTCQLGHDATTGRTARLKKARGNDADTVLVPQPSSDPNDPLNWPLYQRDLVLLLLCYCTNLCVGGVGPLVATIALPILQEFQVSFKDVTLLSGYQLLVVSASAPIVSALSHKYGKRPVYLVSSVLLLAGSILCTAAPSYDTLLGGRILQGLGTAAFESITFSAVGDLYFVHQRGLRMALYVSSAVGMVLLPGLIAGVVAVSLDWRWSFGILSIFMGIATIGIVLFGWETSFVRKELGSSTDTSQGETQEVDKLGSEAVHSPEKVELQQLETVPSSIDTTKRRESFLQRIKPWSRVYDERSLLKMTLQPFYLIANPIVCWAIIINGFAQLWNVVVSFALAQIFSPPPYLMNSAQIGYLNTGPIVAGLVSSLVCGLVSDHMAVVISRRNNGIFEPEFRLLLLLIAPIFSSLGFFLFGRFAEEGKSPIIVSFVWGLAFVSTQVIGTATGSYLVDAYREVDVHIFVLSMSVKNLMFFGFSYFINDWVTEWGPARVFQCIGSIMLGLSATTVPVYIASLVGNARLVVTDRTPARPAPKQEPSAAIEIDSGHRLGWLIAPLLSERKIDSIDRRLQQVIELLSHSNPSLTSAHGNPSYHQFAQATHGFTSPEIPAAAHSTPSPSHTLTPPQILFEEDSTISTDAALAHGLLETAVHHGPLKDYRSETMDALRALVGRQSRSPCPHEAASQRHPSLMRPISSGDSPMPSVHTVMKALQTMKGGSKTSTSEPETDVMLLEDPQFERAGLHMFLTVESFTESVRRVYSPGGGYSLADFIIVNGGLIDVFLKSSILQKDHHSRREMQHCMKACQANLETALSQLPLHMPSTMDYTIALLFGVFHAISCSKLSTACSLVATALNMCLNAGLHRASSMHGDTPAVRRQKAWVFWHIYSIEKGLSLRLGRPSSSIPDYDITMPLPEAESNSSAGKTNYGAVRWIRLSSIQGKVYKLLYSPAALAKPQTSRTAWAHSLAEEARSVWNSGKGDVHEPTSSRKGHTMEGEKPLIHITGDVFFLCTLTLIQKAVPPPPESRSSFTSECINTARTALDKHQEFCEGILSENGHHIDTYFNWTILYNPFIPFIVIFCHVIETMEDSSGDLVRLKLFVDSLETARFHSEATANIHRHFEVLHDVALQYSEMKIKTGMDQLNDPGLQLDAYMQSMERVPDPMSREAANLLLPGLAFGDHLVGDEWHGSHMWFQPGQENWGLGEGNQY